MSMEVADVSGQHRQSVPIDGVPTAPQDAVVVPEQSAPLDYSQPTLRKTNVSASGVSGEGLQAVHGRETTGRSVEMNCGGQPPAAFNFTGQVRQISTDFVGAANGRLYAKVKGRRFGAAPPSANACLMETDDSQPFVPKTHEPVLELSLIHI